MDGAEAAAKNFAVPVAAQEDDVANGAVVELGDLGNIFLAVTALHARGDLQPLGFGQLVGFHELPEAGGIDAARLLHEDVLAGSNGSRVVEGPKTRRGSQYDAVHSGVKRLAIGLAAYENAFLGQIDFVGQNLPQGLGAVPGAVGKNVGQGHELHVLGGAEAIVDRPGAAPAAADQGNLHHVIAGGMCRPGDIHSGGKRRAGRGQGGRILEKTTPRGTGGFNH